jgi:hypothetical protein
MSTNEAVVEAGSAATNDGEAKEQVQWGPYPSAEQARRHPVDRKGWQLFQVTGPDATVFCYATTVGDAIQKVARQFGWSATSAGKPVNKDKLTSMLAALPDAERAELLAQFGGKRKK